MKAKSPDGIIKEIQEENEKKEVFDKIIEEVEKTWDKIKDMVTKEDLEDFHEYIKQIREQFEEDGEGGDA